LIWFGIGNLAFKEAHEDITTWGTEHRRTNPVSGQFRWLIASILLIETLCCWKFRENAGNIIYAETPFYIWMPWTFGITSIFVFWFYLRFKKGHTTKYPLIKINQKKIK